MVPWRELCALVEPYYPKAGNGTAAGGGGADAADLLFAAVVQPVGPGGRRGAVRLAVMRQFVGIDLGREPVPDETTVCKFRHLLEEHRLGEQILGQVNLHLQARGVRITTGTIVDATILHAPTSTKNRSSSATRRCTRRRRASNGTSG